MVNLVLSMFLSMFTSNYIKLFIYLIPVVFAIYNSYDYIKLF